MCASRHVSFTATRTPATKETSMTQSKMTDHRFYELVLAVSLTVVVVVFFLLGIVWKLTFADDEKAAQWGDSFGFVNALFSGLAFAGVIVAIVIQARELRQAFDEAKTSRVAYQTTAQLQHCSSIIDGIATLSKLEEKLSEQSMKIGELTRSLGLLRQVKKDFDHRVLLRKQIDVLSNFDPLVEDSGEAFQRAMKERAANHSQVLFTLALFRLLERFFEFRKEFGKIISGDPIERLQLTGEFVAKTSEDLSRIIDASGGEDVLIDRKLAKCFGSVLDTNVDEDFLKDYEEKQRTANEEAKARGISSVGRGRKVYVNEVTQSVDRAVFKLTQEFVCQCGYQRIYQ